MPVLHVFGRQGCHLCEVLVEELLPLVRGVLAVEVHDIDSRPEWRTAYATRIPVVEYDGRLVCQHHLDRDAIVRLRDQLRDTSAH
ncbi:MAG: glutaredoxin family protein [Gammaproteobacteria bacterium]|nr:glutaredoxin family protein [Gammaproteobacteria bacterium]